MSKRFFAVGLVVALAAAPAWADTQVILINQDGPGEGLNDPTPRSPVPGNAGVTVGQQRRNALLFAANLLASRILSSVPIRIEVKFSALGCDDDNAGLASSGTMELIQFDQGPVPPGARTDVFYPGALANALAGEDRSPQVADIGSVFTSALDDTTDPDNMACLNGADWYYGLDHNPPAGDYNFVSTAVHEFIHGLGFATFTNLHTGAFPGGAQPAPDIFTFFIRDQSVGATWPDMTPAQRVVSATNAPLVVWSGNRTSIEGAPTLSAGTNMQQIRLYAPNPLEGGSSISHWSDAVSPNALMEPFPPSPQDIDVRDGIGLASCVLYDIGWGLASGVDCPDQNGPPVLAGRATMIGNDDIPEPVFDTDGGGGGCTLAAGGAPDPLWLLVLAAAWGLRRRAA
ncbi:MAG: hypothetical protein L0H83_01275 [Salinisphaera sp.]|nr:hypothetical protein [Salinisphaera sp.]